MKALLIIALTARVAVTADVEGWMGVAGVLGTDRITQIHVRNLLLSRDIESAMDGSLIYGVSVPAAKAEQATKLLRADASKSGYSVWFGSNDVVRAAERQPIVSRISVSSALKKRSFASDTALGRFLRNKEIAKLTAKYPYIISISVYERQYLTTPKECGTGYDVGIELRKSLRNQDEGYRGSYQVYDRGRSVVSLGSNEWKIGDK